MIKAEFQKSFNIKLFIFLITIGIVVLLFNSNNFISDINKLEKNPFGELNIESLTYEEINEIQGRVNDNVKQYKNGFMAWRFSIWGYEIICILLASGVYAFSYVIDQRSGFIKNITLRVKKEKYFLNKYIINFLLGGLVVVIPVVIILIVFIVRYGVEQPTLKAYFPVGFMSEFFKSNPYIYIIFFISNLFFIGATYSTFSMAIGSISKNIISSTLVPIIYWFAGSLFAVGIELYEIAPWNIYYFSSEPLYSFTKGLIHSIILLIISTLIIIYESKKEDF